MGTSEEEIIGSYAFLIIGLIILFLVCIVVFRWIFRINRIVSLLESIARNVSNIPALPLSPPKLKQPCAVCKKIYDADRLIKIESGHLLCFDCHKLHKRFDNKEEGQL